MLRRGGRELVDDAIDRVRQDFVAVVALHVLPSVPVFAAVLLWCADIDLRGAMPAETPLPISTLLVPKILGWAALCAWAARRARSRETSIRECGAVVLRRLPEVVLAGSLTLLAFAASPFTLGISLALAAAALVGLAGAVAPTTDSARELMRQTWKAVTQELATLGTIVFLLVLAWAFITLNLVVLPHLVAGLGGGALGFDMELLLSSLSPSRMTTWTFAGLIAGLVVEAVLVVAAAELHADREAEREGARFEAFASELEDRASRRMQADSEALPVRAA